MQIPLANIDAVHQDTTPLNIIKAVEQLTDGGLARAGRADQGDTLTRSDRKGHVPQYPLLLVVRKPDVVKFYPARHLVRSVRRRRRGQRDRRI